MPSTSPASFRTTSRNTIRGRRCFRRSTSDCAAATSWPSSETSALRANDLIWPYVVSNYLKGKSPDAFDLLYWNADSTNLPGPMYCWYLRNTYLETTCAFRAG